MGYPHQLGAIYLTLTIKIAIGFMQQQFASRTTRYVMLVCQCNMITSQEIEDIVLHLLQQDPWQLVVPAKVYRELDRRARCSGCVPNVVDIIVRVTESYHLQQASAPEHLVDIQAGLAKLKKIMSGGPLEGRSTGHRAA